MKRLAVVVALLIAVGVMAQEYEDHTTRKGEKMDMTAEQMATLQTKKLTLALDLSEKQQKQVMQVALKASEHRKAKQAEIKAQRESGTWQKPTAEERFEMKNALLDRQIAHNQKMKEILTETQYETWKKMEARKAKYLKKKMKERRKNE